MLSVAGQVRWYLALLTSLLLGLNCASPPQQVNEPVGAQSPLKRKIAPPQIIPSIRDRPAPPILGVNYVETIGRGGQGAGQFVRPAGLSLDHRGRLYVADSGNNRIQAVDADGNFVAEFGVRGWRTGELDNPSDVAINFQRTELLYFADTGNNRIQYCNLVDRIFHVMIGGTSALGFQETETDDGIDLDGPRGVGIGRNGEVHVVDTGNNRFVRFNADGIAELMLGSFGSGREQFRDPTDLVVDARGNVYIVDSGNHRIAKYDFSGNLMTMWGTEGSGFGQFREPSYIARDRWNYLYVTDRGNRRVQIFTPEGQPVMEFSNETLIDPVGIAVSKADQVFISDFGANDIKVFQVIYRP